MDICKLDFKIKPLYFINLSIKTKPLYIIFRGGTSGY